MPAAYPQLLEAALHHLEALKARGTRFVTVDAATLAALSQPALRPPASVRPAAAAPPRSSAPALSLQPAPAVATPAMPAPTPSAPTPRPSSDAKIAAMAALRERALACVKCPHLASSRKNVVFGVGNIDADLMFVGEAPGADEDAAAEPFVGAAGQLLTRIIQAMGLTRQQVYIANILKCRPDTPGQSRGNRKPTPEEMATCIPYLHEQIDLIQPRVLVALGGVAIEGLLQKSGITKLRGTWQTYRGIPLMPTFHPSFLLHREGSGERAALGEKRKVWEDMMQVMATLNLPISDKQRGYFLPRSA